MGAPEQRLIPPPKREESQVNRDVLGQVGPIPEFAQSHGLCHPEQVFEEVLFILKDLKNKGVTKEKRVYDKAISAVRKLSKSLNYR